jgi:SpoVK/Ycf46/Vps4 family AAA+-type ATPase
MPSPLLDLFSGRFGGRRAVETIDPQRTLSDVVLPPTTRRALEQALSQVRSHALIFDRWGLGERHATGLGLAFNFAGPPGTGKTLCAEAIARALGKKLLAVRYAEVESMWAGETPKNVAALFRAAGEHDAVLFFDEADSIASRRSTDATQAYLRESNTVVNVLLKELEAFNGVVIFATNLAVNFDPAFERRIRAHVLFEPPGPAERAEIWKLQIHPLKTPLADDVDFAALAERHDLTGGDIKNAVIKAAAAAATEPVQDRFKRIHQQHFESAAIEVLAARGVMQQSLFKPAGETPEDRLVGVVRAAEERWRAMTMLALGAAGVAGVIALIGLVLTLAR